MVATSPGTACWPRQSAPGSDSAMQDVSALLLNLTNSPTAVHTPSVTQEDSSAAAGAAPQEFITGPGADKGGHEDPVEALAHLQLSSQESQPGRKRHCPGKPPTGTAGQSSRHDKQVVAAARSEQMAWQRQTCMASHRFLSRPPLLQVMTAFRGACSIFEYVCCMSDSRQTPNGQSHRQAHFATTQAQACSTNKVRYAGEVWTQEEEWNPQPAAGFWRAQPALADSVPSLPDARRIKQPFAASSCQELTPSSWQQTTEQHSAGHAPAQDQSHHLRRHWPVELQQQPSSRQSPAHQQSQQFTGRLPSQHHQQQSAGRMPVQELPQHFTGQSPVQLHPQHSTRQSPAQEGSAEEVASRRPACKGGLRLPSLLMRLIDDFLFVTPSRAAAEALVNQLMKGRQQVIVKHSQKSDCSQESIYIQRQACGTQHLHHPRTTHQAVIQSHKSHMAHSCPKLYCQCCCRL